MRLQTQLPKLLGITLAILVGFLCIANVTYARGGGGGSGGCFTGDTPILTPLGFRPIQNLKQGSEVISYSFPQHQTEIGIVDSIQEIESTDYYVINNSLKVTGTHPFYVRDPDNVKQVEVRYLKIGDRLLGEGADIPISSLQHIVEPIIVYNLISVTPNHNFYAGGVLVHNKGGSGVGYTGHHYRECFSSNLCDERPIQSPGIKAGIILVLGLLPGAFLTEIYNFTRFYGKMFTDDDELLQYTREVLPDFTNRYSIRYRNRSENWNLVPLKSSIPSQCYQHFLSESELKILVCDLFYRYQKDWMNRDFVAMQDYVSEPFFGDQYTVFQNKYGDHIDIVYAEEVLGLSVLDCQEEEGQTFIEIQVNARMINFVLTPKGYVIRGRSEYREFTEYWTLRLAANTKVWLTDISQYYCK